MGESPAPKRRKTLLACEHCRNKKIKCDGNHPVCGSCVRKGWGENKCIWKHVDGREESISQELVHDLQKRIQHLENQSWTDSAGSEVLPAMTECSHGTHSAGNITDPSGPSPGVSAIEGAVTGQAQNEGFIGSSSAAAFMDLIRRAVDPKAQGSLPSIASWRSPTDLEARSSRVSQSYVLPRRKHADSLVRTYWNYVHPLYPFLNRTRFGQIYNSLWTGTTLPTSSSSLTAASEANSVCIVNLVLALGCQYFDGSTSDSMDGEGSKTAEVYFARARTVLNYDPVESTDQSLQLVQAMLLMAQYLKGTGSTHKAWGMMGLAIRTCQKLGLHLAATSMETVLPDLVDRELVRRVWHGCIMIERMVCMTLGRPAMVSSGGTDSVPLPLAVDEEFFQSGDLQPGASTDSYSGRALVSFFILSAKLYDLVQRILLAFYSEDRPGSSFDYDHYFTGPHSVFEIESQMKSWLASIPTYIQLEDSKGMTVQDEEQDMPFQRQAVVLRLRYLQARIYLLKPILSRVCTASRDRSSWANIGNGIPNSAVHESLSARTALYCSLLCVKSALELIEVTNDNLTTAETWGRKPSWLYGVLHVYLAATVLLAARLAPSILLGEVSESDIQKSWTHALKILRTFQSDMVSAQRCVTALEMLYRKLPGNRETGDQTGQQVNFTQPVNTANPEAEQLSHLNLPVGSLDEEVAGPQDAFQPYTSQWLMDFDLSDPYDMSWFQLPSDLDLA